MVRNAGWTPHYDIKAINTAQPLELIYNAKVYNETDIEWNNIPLTLSAADPQQEASKPELKRWELNYSRSSKFKSYQANSGYINQAKMDSINGGIMVAVENLNAEFPIKESVSIPSGSAPFFIQISKHNLPASYKHYCAPKEETSAFLLARVSDW